MGAEDPGSGPRRGPGRRRATLADIARIVGVSEATISRALRDDPQISLGTRRLAQQVANDLEYVPNLAARNLASRRSRTLGLVIPDMTDPMHGGVVTGFEQTAAERGYAVVVLNSFRDAGREVRAFRELRAHQADGVAFCGTVTDPAVAQAAVRPGHAVFIDPAGPRPSVMPAGASFVITNETKGILDLVTHLHDTGRSRLSYVAGPPIASDRIRRDAIGRALERLGLEPRLRVYAPAETWDDHLRIVDLVAHERPEALVCYDDRAALTVMSALRERGLRVPADVAVTGFDDIPFARLANPRLTTVAQPVEEMGARAAAMLIEAIETGERQPSVTLPVELIVRESSAPVPAPAGASPLG